MNDVTPTSDRRQISKIRDLSLEPFNWLRGEIDRLFDDFPPRSHSLFNFPVRSLVPVPALDMTEDEKEYRIAAELPGLSDQDVDVSVADGILSITGEKREEKSGKEHGAMISERRYGRFERQVALPSDVNPDNIKAQFSRGILTLSLPKDEKAAARTRKIAIEKA